MTRAGKLPHLVALLAGLALTACDGGRTIEKVDESEGAYLRLLRGDRSELLDPHATNSGGDADLRTEGRSQQVRDADEGEQRNE